MVFYNLFYELSSFIEENRNLLDPDSVLFCESSALSMHYQCMPFWQFALIQVVTLALLIDLTLCTDDWRDAVR